MSLYLDTGLLVQLYVEEEYSTQADRLVGKEKSPIPLCPLHQLEFRNAVQLKCFRGELAAAAAVAILLDFQADLDARRYRTIQPDPNAWWSDAMALSRGHSSRLGTRSLDVLHVAAAKLFGSTVFASTDHRQRALAKAAGLRVAPTL